MGSREDRAETQDHELREYGNEWVLIGWLAGEGLGRPDEKGDIMEEETRVFNDPLITLLREEEERLSLTSSNGASRDSFRSVN